MKFNKPRVLSNSIMIAFLMVFGVSAGAQEDFMRAKIGVLIKSGDKAIRAKSKDKLKAGDLKRIHTYAASIRLNHHYEESEFDDILKQMHNLSCIYRYVIFFQ